MARRYRVPAGETRTRNWLAGCVVDPDVYHSARSQPWPTVLHGTAPGPPAACSPAGASRVVAVLGGRLACAAVAVMTARAVAIARAAAVMRTLTVPPVVDGALATLSCGPAVRRRRLTVAGGVAAARDAGGPVVALASKPSRTSWSRAREVVDREDRVVAHDPAVRGAP